MSHWFQWVVLTAILGNPLLAAAIVLVFWWGADRFTFRMLPDPVRFVMRRLRARRLERSLMTNPHDRRARFELADLLLERKNHARAAELMRANLEEGEEDPASLYMMGLSLFGTGHHGPAEKLMEAAEEADPNFRVGAISLERGRWRLAAGDFAGARSALERFIQQRTGTVEGRVLLARALEGAGDAVGASKLRRQAWSEYVLSPFHLQRIERFWAWRARPSRPALYLAVVAICGVLFARYVAPSAEAWLGERDYAGHHAAPGGEDFGDGSEF